MNETTHPGKCSRCGRMTVIGKKCSECPTDTWTPPWFGAQVLPKGK